MNELFLKIYVENGDTLVLEGQGSEDKDGYYPTRWDKKTRRIGTVACGKEHISITKEAKAMFKEIILKAHHTGDDISCLDIQPSNKYGATVSYIGPIVTRFNAKEVIADDEFFIGTGEGIPDLSLLDELIQA